MIGKPPPATGPAPTATELEVSAQSFPPPPPVASPPGPREHPRASLRFVAAASAAGLLAAILLPGSGPGVGLFVTGLAVAAAAAVGARPSRSGWNGVFVALGVALGAMAFVRSAEWVVAVDLMAAAGLASLVMAGGSTWRRMAGAPFLVSSRLPLVPGFLVRPVALATRGRARRFAAAGRGLAVGIVLLVVFGALFATADRAFARIAADVLLPEWDLSTLPARVLLFAGASGLAGALVLAHPRWVAVMRARTLEGPASRRGRSLAPTEWAVALGLLNALFLAFVLVQVTVLFGGRRHVLETAGLSYAEYARQGFFQLVAVGVLTLVVVGATVALAGDLRTRERRVRNALLGGLCALTLVILVSALRRLTLYEDTFGFTSPRLVIHAVILWLAGIFLLVMAAGLLRGRPWLPRAAVAFTAAALLAFTAINPEKLVAANNVDRFAASGRIDVDYLRTLGPDAVPALAALPDGLRRCVLSVVAVDLQEPEWWAERNLGRERARDVLSRVGIEGQASCSFDATGVLP